jgi:hypothetical protein
MKPHEWGKKLGSGMLLLSFCSAVCVATYFGWIYASGLLHPPHTALLAVDFEENPPSMRVKGVLQKDGNAPSEGRVRVSVESVESASTPYNVSFITSLSEGRFEIAQIKGLSRDDKFRVKAQFHTIEGHHVTEEVFHNIRPPYPTALILSVIAFILIFSTLFFWAFTGRPSSAKNRTAIIVSYCIIFVFLALPLIAPIFVPHWFPGIQDTMNHSIVGVVVTSAHHDPPDPNDLQWMLNIGGYATPIKAASPPSEGSSNEPKSFVPSPIVDVKGGLVIPFYIVILSVIGGAINMTRQVPTFQEKSESKEWSFLTTIKERVASSVTHLLPSHVAASSSVKQQLKEISMTETVETSVPNEVTSQLGKTSTNGNNPNVGNFRSVTTRPGAIGHKDDEERRANDWEWAASWRAGLMCLYMYLLAAPFLAIATYYLLDWLGLVKTPILVLVSFSIGLISDKIVDAILGVASGLLSNRSGSGSGLKGPMVATQEVNGKLDTPKAEYAGGQL